MLNEARAVAFDLDGTLVDSSLDLHNSATYLRKLYGLPEGQVSDTMAGIGRGATHLVRRVLQRDEAEDISEQVGQFRAHYNAHSCDHSRAFDGVVPLLQDLQGAGVKIAIVTNKPQDSAAQVIKGLGLPHDLLVGESERFPPKPATDMLEYAIKTLNVPKLRTIFVGDMRFDYQCARAAMCAFIGVDFGYLPDSKLRDHCALCVQDVQALRLALWSSLPED